MKDKIKWSYTSNEQVKTEIRNIAHNYIRNIRNLWTNILKGICVYQSIQIKENPHKWNQQFSRVGLQY